MVQLELGYDPAEARRGALEAERVPTLEAIEQAGANAPEGWIAEARAAIRHVAEALPFFISDEIWGTGLSEPPEARAIGNVIKWAASEGLIAPTDDFVPSARPGCHRVPRRVWKSLVYEGAA